MTRVLIITYYWPPAGGPGVQRWLAFAKYLPENDIEPVIFIPENASYPIRDESLISQVPEGIKYYKKRIWEPYAWANLLIGKKSKKISSGVIESRSQSLLEKMAIWIRGNCFIPDARKFWVGPAVKSLRRIIEAEKIETIITTGPPHSVHLIGLKLKRELDLRWIADFRDPWTSIGYHKKLRLTDSSERKHKRLEEEVLTSADKLITTSRTTLEEFSQISQQPIKVITNGYEDHQLETSPILDQNFSLSFIGSLLSGRNPENLWSVLSVLVKEIPEFAKNLRLQIVGVVSEDVLNAIYSNNLMEYTVHIPYVPHTEAVKIQRISQILLLLEIDSDETKGIIPGKLFEYMAAKRPILAIGPNQWEAGEMVRETNSGAYFGYHSYDDLRGQLLQWYEQYRGGGVNAISKPAEQYSRRNLTASLAKEIAWE